MSFNPDQPRDEHGMFASGEQIGKDMEQSRMHGYRGGGWGTM